MTPLSKRIGGIGLLEQNENRYNSDNDSCQMERVDEEMDEDDFERDTSIKF